MTHLVTDTYYEEHAADYFHRTHTLDSMAYLAPFTSHLKTGDLVLDLGCGSGRDLLLFKQLGFCPTGVEKSGELAQMARNHSGCTVRRGDFTQMDFSKDFAKGLLFSGSLVHVPYEKMESALKNVLGVLHKGGFVYVSLKRGQGTLWDQKKRLFYLWEPGDAHMLFETMGLKILDYQETASAYNPNDTWLSYTMYYENVWNIHSHSRP